MKRTVCLDLDGVLADYSKGWKGLDQIGDPIPGAQLFTKQLAEFADVVIFTTRCCEDMSGRNGYKAPLLKKFVTEWLDKHGFTYHDVYVGQGKPIASAYIDDRAIACTPQSDARAYPSAIVKAKRFCNVEQDAGEKDG
jgi:hypothetical protein